MTNTGRQKYEISMSEDITRRRMEMLEVRGRGLILNATSILDFLF